VGHGKDLLRAQRRAERPASANQSGR